jgi:serine/threonine protein kinase
MTLAYAAPEVLAAFAGRQMIPADPAQDIWALGVMAYECLTHSTVFPTFRNPRIVFAVAAGQSKYPWEEDVLDETFRRSRARKLVLACLDRNPRSRVTAAELLKTIDAFGNTITTEAPV